MRTIITLLLFFSLSTITNAEYVFWKGAVDSNWHNPLNWLSQGGEQRVPGTADDVSLSEFTKINHPILSTATRINGIQINEGWVLTISETATLTVTGWIDTYGGTLINRGRFLHQSATGSPPQNYFQSRGCIFENYGTAVFRSMYNIVLMGDKFDSYVYNHASGRIELYGSNIGIQTFEKSFIELVNDGYIYYGGTNELFKFAQENETTFINRGRIVAKGKGILNGSNTTFNNMECGVIDLRGTAGITNQLGVMNNAGVMLSEIGLKNTGTLVNTGIIKASSFESYTNQGIQITHNGTHNSLFEISASTPLSIANIYKDSSDVNLAGTYSAPNDFLPNSMQTNLFAHVTGGSCSYFIPFRVDLSGLPVTLTNFNVTKEAQQTHLSWSTSSENYSSHFEIEHSMNARDWKLLGLVASNKESTSTQTYHFTHTNSVLGHHYYRLKMVDQDNSFEYSPIRSLFISGEKIVVGNFYPNPSTSIATIDMTLNQPDQVTITTFDLTGKILYTKTQQLNAGKNQVEVPPTGKGIRVVQLSTAQQTVIRRLVNE